MKPSLSLSPRVAPGTLTPKTGGEIAFERVFLDLQDEGSAPAAGLRLTLDARQGADVICEMDEALAAGAPQTWDLYDLFLAKGRGFPSKVHMFGVKAALGWNFTVRASVGDAEAAFRFRWSGDPAGPITATVEALS